MDVGVFGEICRRDIAVRDGANIEKKREQRTENIFEVA